MYEFREIQNEVLWNEFLNEISSKGFISHTFFHSYLWGDFYKSNGHDIYRFAIFEGEVIKGVCLGSIINAKRGKYIHFRHGPVFDWGDVVLVNAFINHVKSFAKSKKVWFIRLSPLIEKSTKQAEKFFKFTDQNTVMYDLEGTNTWVTDLSSGDEEILFNLIKKKTRYEIRKAQGLCEVVISQSVDDLDFFFKIEEETIERKNWRGYSNDYIRKEFELFAKNNKANLIMVKFKGNYIAGGIFINDDIQMYYHYGATSNLNRDVPGAYLYVWEAIKLAILKNLRVFNFWGITSENAKSSHPWTGLTQFKMKFNGYAKRYVTPRDIVISPLYYATRLFDVIDKYKKGH